MTIFQKESEGGDSKRSWSPPPRHAPQIDEAAGTARPVLLDWGLAKILEEPRRLAFAKFLYSAYDKCAPQPRQKKLFSSYFYIPKKKRRDIY